MFLIKGEMLVNSREYAGTMLKAGEFMLQPISSKIEMLAMTDVECIYYQFNQPELFCDIRYNRIMKETDPPLIPSPLPIIPELQHFLESARTYLSEKKICRDLLSLKRKELAFILGYFYCLCCDCFCYGFLICIDHSCIGTNFSKQWLCNFY